MLPRRFRRRTIGLVFFLASVFLSGFASGNKPKETHQPQTSVTSSYSVIKVIDGDTIELDNGKRVRYIGIDTPESVDPRQPVQCFSKEAAEKNKDLVLNKTVYLEKDVSETDRYGRWLRYVYVQLPEGKKSFVNEMLVRGGFARAVSFPPDVAYQDVFRNAETEARESHKGLWSACPLPRW